jgi:hypothetical protein
VVVAGGWRLLLLVSGGWWWLVVAGEWWLAAGGCCWWLVGREPEGCPGRRHQRAPPARCSLLRTGHERLHVAAAAAPMCTTTYMDGSTVRDGASRGRQLPLQEAAAAAAAAAATTYIPHNAITIAEHFEMFEQHNRACVRTGEKFGLREDLGVQLQPHHYLPPRRVVLPPAAAGGGGGEAPTRGESGSPAVASKWCRAAPSRSSIRCCCCCASSSWGRHQ